ncbi:allophanate hydrolase [Nocardioides baekrokdamisoli]|uniref:Allophanate hydrolase n=1 Tax=Nocardioides baekrokdamisoli TaxID=1804624 RepID=A0A3G9ICQ8_9ACTN|nr:allophanate hydrolase [Nocardioides baekrokdamisoli]BBH16740.1 allophanate hydrolase [Nocardioides baekrokdamisoli]
MSGQPTAWISRHVLAGADLGPLAGLRFAVKDNIAVAGVPTTAADPRRTTPAAAHAHVVQRLLDAGASVAGTTNMDQYATGLVGTRSPYGLCHAVDSPDHVSGGSSSGSAVVVAGGEVDFALGTDTAGSGRVPAAFNGLVGIKPSRGLVSATGVVPACRSLDCVTVFARTLATARTAYEVMVGHDPHDPYARLLTQVSPTEGRARIAVPLTPLDLEPTHAQAWEAALAAAAEVAELVPVDIGPLLEAAALLYSGPWLAERWLAFGAAMDEGPEVDPTVRTIVRAGATITGAETFAGFHQLAQLAQAASGVWLGVDALLLPVTPEHPTIAEVDADPIGVNARLGRFTNMTNLLDLCAIAFPGPRRVDGLPFGVQLLAPAGADDRIHAIAADLLGEPRPAASAGRIKVAVAGAHLSGQPLNADLVARGGRLVRSTRTAADYRMFSVPGPLPRPGLTRVIDGEAGDGIEVEVWSLPTDAVGGFAATILPPLALGPVDLIDGQRVLGFVCTADGADPERDISSFGGWRSYLSR